MSAPLAKLLRPIRKDAPGGDDVRYSSEYERLQAEIDKRTSLTGAARTDWEVVGGLAASILEKQSKDLLVAAYHAAALCHLQGIAGFGLGVDLLDACCRNFWQTMHPSEQRMQGRVNAIDWWMENAGAFLRAWDSQPPPLDEVNKTKKRVIALGDLLQTRSPDFSSLQPLARLLENLGEMDGAPSEEAVSARPQEGKKAPRKAKRTPASGAAEPAAPAQPPPVEQEAPPTAAPGQTDRGGTEQASPLELAPIASDEECRQAQARLSALIAGVCSWRLPRSPQDSYCYFMNRAAAWGDIDALPHHVSGRTALAPADTSFRELLEDLRGQGAWETLLARSELMLRAHPFWLDLCRFVDESLASLGKGYDRTRSLCAGITACFLARLPGVEELQYADGTAFADAATRKWLAKLHSASGTKALSLEDTLNRSREEALADIRAGNALGAIRKTQAHMDGAKLPTERFRWRMLLAQLLNEADQPHVARVHFNLLLTTIEQHGLEQWDTELALAGLCAAYKGISAEPGEDITDTRLGLLKKISHLSPAAALQLLHG